MSFLCSQLVVSKITIGIYLDIQVVFAWIKGGTDSDIQCELKPVMDGGQQEVKIISSNLNRPLVDLAQKQGSPINELLYWHNAIRKELREFVSEARQIRLMGDMAHPNISAFIERLQFLAEVCTFHRF